MKEETYLEFLDGNLTGHTFGCPFPLPTTRPYQAMALIAIIYKSAMELQEVLKVSGHKMNEHALLAFRREIGQSYFEIMTFKACVEN